MTITLSDLIKWRDALEPVGHLHSIQVDGEHLSGYQNTVLCDTYHAIETAVTMISKETEVEVLL